MAQTDPRSSNFGLGTVDFVKWEPAGRVVSVQPRQKRLRVRPQTKDFVGLENLYDIAIRENDKGLRRFSLVSAEGKGKTIVLTLRDCAPEEVASLKGKEILVRSRGKRQLEEGEYYWEDLIGLPVRGTRGEELGKIREIYETGANDIYEVVDDTGIETLVPAVRAVIKEVDLERNIMIVDSDSLEVATDED